MCKKGCSKCGFGDRWWCKDVYIYERCWRGCRAECAQVVMAAVELKKKEKKDKKEKWKWSDFEGF